MKQLGDTVICASEIEEFPMAVTRYHFPEEPLDEGTTH